MTGLAAFLSELNRGYEQLMGTLPCLTRALDRAAQLERLANLVREIKSIHETVVIDNEVSFGARSPRTWVVVGDGGIPDDAMVVAEGMSIFSLGIEQPDLDSYRGEGNLIISGKDFLNLAGWLRGEALAGRIALPYQLSGGT